MARITAEAAVMVFQLALRNMVQRAYRDFSARSMPSVTQLARGQSFGGDQAIARFDQLGDELPVETSDIQPHSNPALGTDVRRHVEGAGIVFHQTVALERVGLAPQRRPPVADLVHGEDLVPDAEGG